MGVAILGGVKCHQTCLLILVWSHSIAPLLKPQRPGKDTDVLKLTLRIVLCPGHKGSLMNFLECEIVDLEIFSLHISWPLRISPSLPTFHVRYFDDIEWRSEMRRFKWDWYHWLDWLVQVCLWQVYHIFPGDLHSAWLSLDLSSHHRNSFVFHTIVN